MRVAAVILAAGAATRMGKIKQLLPFRGTNLTKHAVRTAHDAGFDPVIVVVGAAADSVRNALLETEVVVVENPRWETGMGSSVAAGVRCLESVYPEAEAVAILLADQPLVEAHHLRAMAAQLAAAGIVAAHYAGALGVPALFHKALFPALIKLDGEAGARSILRNPEHVVTPFDLPEAAVDVDTPEEFAALENSAESAEP